MSLLMIDLSNNNFGGDPSKVKTVDFARMKAEHGAEYCGIKLTEGSTFVDSCGPTVRHQAQNAGINTLFYHFADGDSASLEADHFSAHFIKTNMKDRRPYLDFENAKLPESWAREFNQRVLHNIGIIPGFYSYSALIAAMKPSQPIGDGLWVANYNRNDGKPYPVVPPPGWKSIVAHQFTSHATVVGVPFPVDLSNVVLPNALLIPQGV